MALTQTNRLVWLITTTFIPLAKVRKAGKITFKELNDKWRDNDDMSNHKDLSRRSFQKWKQDCADRFGIFIYNENKGEYRYCGLFLLLNRRLLTKNLPVSAKMCIFVAVFNKKHCR